MEADPHETRNLASSSDHQSILAEHRAALDDWILETRDMGDIPEQTLIERGLVKDLLNNEYRQRTLLHPQTPPVP